MGLAFLKYAVPARTLARLMAADDAAGPDAPIPVLKLPGRPAVAWGRDGAESAWQHYREMRMAPDGPNSASCYRRLVAMRAAEGWIIPSENTFRQRWNREAASRPGAGRTRISTTNTKKFRGNVGAKLPVGTSEARGRTDGKSTRRPLTYP